MFQVLGLFRATTRYTVCTYCPGFDFSALRLQVRVVQYSRLYLYGTATLYFVQLLQYDSDSKRNYSMILTRLDYDYIHIIIKKVDAMAMAMPLPEYENR